MTDEADHHFDGPYRRWHPDGLVEFLSYDGALEWRGRPLTVPQLRPRRLQRRSAQVRQLFA
jgi:hypothetical protein